MDQTLYFFGKRGRHNLPVNVSALKCLLQFLLRLAVTKELNFILAAGTSAMVSKGPRNFFKIYLSEREGEWQEVQRDRENPQEDSPLSTEPDVGSA